MVDKKPFCDLCGAEFSSKMGLLKHLVKGHSKEEFRVYVESKRVVSKKEE